MKPRLIKKYKNRRLYDTFISSYVTLENLKVYVQEGVQFTIVDSLTKKDITTQNLLQLLIELEEEKLGFLSPEILRQLILWSQHPMSQQYKEFLEQSLLPIQQNFTELWSKQTLHLFDHWQGLLRETTPS